MNFRQSIIKWKEGNLISNGINNRITIINEQEINKIIEIINKIEPINEKRKKKKEVRIL